MDNLNPSHSDQRRRATAYFQRRNLDVALLSTAATVRWLTGVVPPTELGVLPFVGAQPLVWYERGAYTLLIADVLAPHARTFSDQIDCPVEFYEGYSVDHSLAPQAHLEALLRHRVRSCGAELGVELDELPAYLQATLAGLVTSRRLDGWATALRQTKAAEEIKLLEHNFGLADVGQAAAKLAVRAGATEIGVFTEVQAAIQQAAGERVPIGNDFVVGSRSNNIGGWPTDRPIAAGNSFIADISTVRYGYWSDGCATYYAGMPSDKQIQMHIAAANALHVGESLLRPGAVCGDIDRAVKASLEDDGFPAYPHHTGHGVGVQGHEAPRLVPYSDEVLEPGMVIMLEPGIYFGGQTAVRLEHGYLIVEDGARRLTNHITDLPE